MKSFRLFLESDQYIKEPGTQYGSNEGGLYTSPSGSKHYVKFYENPDQAKVEALTGKLYDHMGINTVNPELKSVNGREAITTPWNDKLGQMKPHEFDKLTPEQAHQLGKMFHAAVLSKNWDILGLEHDNVIKNKETGDLHAIDHGGAFHFRARGGPKHYGPDIDEHDSLMNNDQPSGKVFRSLDKQYPDAIHNAAREVLPKLDDEKVEHIFRNSGLTNWPDLYNNFNERKNKLKGLYKT